MWWPLCPPYDFMVDSVVCPFGLHAKVGAEAAALYNEFRGEVGGDQAEENA